MKDKKLISVKTSIDKKDYHKFLYIATFLRRKLMIPMIILVSVIMAGVVAFNKEVFKFTDFFIYWAILLGITFFAIVIKVETRNREKIKADKINGSLKAQETLEFYDDFVVIKSTAFKSKSKLKYSKFHDVIETKNYFIIYFNRQQASIIRKADLDNEIIGDLENLFIEKLKGKYRRI